MTRPRCLLDEDGWEYGPVPWANDSPLLPVDNHGQPRSPLLDETRLGITSPARGWCGGQLAACGLSGLSAVDAEEDAAAWAGELVAMLG